MLHYIVEVNRALTLESSLIVVSMMCLPRIPRILSGKFSESDNVTQHADVKSDFGSLLAVFRIKTSACVLVTCFGKIQYGKPLCCD